MTLQERQEKFLDGLRTLQKMYDVKLIINSTMYVIDNEKTDDKPKTVTSTTNSSTN